MFINMVLVGGIGGITEKDTNKKRCHRACVFRNTLKSIRVL